jgi:hypothetical protein
VSAPAITKRSRVSAIVDRYGRNKVLAVAAVVVFALATALSGAIYVVTTDSTASTDAGSITMSNDKEGTFIANASNMAPGASRNGDVVIHNTGDAADYRITADAAQAGGTGTGDLPATLDLTIQDVTVPASPVTKFTGKFNADLTKHGNQNYVDLGSFTADLSRTYRFTLSWPGGSTNTNLQSTTASRAFHFEAAQQ